MCLVTFFKADHVFGGPTGLKHCYQQCLLCWRTTMAAVILSYLYAFPVQPTSLDKCKAETMSSDRA